jgi:hypothetical protein
MKKRILPALLMSVLISSAISQTTITLQPDAVNGKDALLHGLFSQVNNNFGSNAQFTAAAATFSFNPGIIRSIVAFDLSSVPANATITNAKLSLYAWGQGSGLGSHLSNPTPNNGWLERVTSTWNESAVTWNTMPSTTILNRAALPVSISPTQDYLNTNVTSLVQDMVNNPTSSFGFMMKLDDETPYATLAFFSSDCTDSTKRPKLVIEYVVPTSTDSCISLQPNPLNGKDALLHGLSSQVNNNFGSNVQFTAAASTFSAISGVLRSIVEFDLSSVPTNANIVSAGLSFHAWGQVAGLGPHSTQSGTNESWLERITSTWNESTVTWNNQPSTTTLNRVLLAASSAPTQNYLNTDVTLLVQDMINNPSTSFGFMLKLDTESPYRTMAFYSSDAASSALRPSLDICYSTANGLSKNNTINPVIVLYPNPANEFVTVKLNHNHSNTPYEVIDQIGRIVLKGQFNETINTLNLNDLKTGIYFLKIETINNQMFKIIKK